jgi:response regulator RpfG family c-di-GMP phosphodiesterase
MIQELQPIAAVLSSPNSAREDTARALIELSRLLYPEKNAAFRQSVLISAQIFARALELVDALGVEAEGEPLAQCLIAIARSAYVSGQPLKGLPPAQRAVDLLSRLGPRTLLHTAVNVHGALLMDTGNLPRAIETFAAAMEIAFELGDQIGEATALNNLGIALLYAAQYGESLLCLRRAVALSEMQPQSAEAFEVVRGTAQMNIAVACLHLEDYAPGLDAAKAAIEALRHPASANEMFSRVLAEASYARLLLEVDAADEAGRHCETAKRIAHESGLERAEVEAAMAEGLCEVHSGRIDVGLSRLSKTLAAARALKGSLRDALITMVKANEMANRHAVALVYLRELMKHTRQVRQEHALLHHRLHLEALQRQEQARTLDTETLMEHREVALLDKVVSQAAQRAALKARMEMLERVATMASLREDPSGLRPYRVGKLAALLAQDLGWDEETVFMVELAARLHDIGKIGIPEGLLMTKRRLNDAEIKLAQTHVLIGADILAQSNVAHMKMAEEIARFHHEHWDGGGYPFGLAYSAIPIAARITALADVFDSMTHPRPCQDASSADDALATIAALRGKQFDPELTDLFRVLVLRLQRDVGDLDEYLSQAAHESPFIRARQKLTSTLKGFSDSHPIGRR